MIELRIDTDLCTYCLDCVECCTNKALCEFEGIIIFDSNQCAYCEVCIDVCTEEAITITGELEP